MQLLTSELYGSALDWAVAKAQDKFVQIGSVLTEGRHVVRDRAGWVYKPSSDWCHGGPIIEKEKITISPYPSVDYKAHYGNGTSPGNGHTMLIAAMRAFIQRRLGPIVEIPDELCNPT